MDKLLTTIKPTSGSKTYIAIDALYTASFPGNERSPLHLLVEDPSGCS